MNIYYSSPYSTDKLLGRAYNDLCSIVPNDDDFICLIDGDVMFLNSNYGHIIEAAIKNNPQYQLFTCYASRIKNPQQMYQGKISEDPNIIHHWEIAQRNAIENKGKVKELKQLISGHVMIFSKWLWKQIPFVEQTKRGTILGIDNVFSSQVLKSGYRIGLIEDLYVLHYYRMKQGIDYREHLK